MTRRAPRPRVVVAIILSACLALAVVVGVVGNRDNLGTPNGLAGRAEVTASSAEYGHPARAAVTTGSSAAADPGWQSGRETTGAWIDLAWREPVELRRVVLVRPVDQPGIRAGFFTFGDGSQVQVQLSTTSAKTVVPIAVRTVDQLRFTVSAVSDGAKSVTLSRLDVDDRVHAGDVVVGGGQHGDVADAAGISASDPSADKDVAALVDGDPTTRSTGRTWSTAAKSGSWVQLTWRAPREITTVTVAGATGASAVGASTLQFSDGSELTLGEVLPDPDHPTVVSFLPRVATSVRLIFGAADEAARVELSEIGVLERSAPTVGPSGRGSVVTPTAADSCSPSTARPDDDHGLVVLCPTAGTRVSAQATVHVLLSPRYTDATAIVWPSDRFAPEGAPVRGTPDADGRVDLTLDLARVPPGPFNVRIVATAAGRADSTAVVQLYREGALPPNKPTDATLNGRTLVYDDEFDAPLSISSSGSKADYAAAKPEVQHVSQFGDAIFPDPKLGFGNVATVDNDYLRISVRPMPDGYADPQGWNRRSIGGLLASARPGGSGFSAQYGYFEARMLAPAAPGTWPAFWMLPSSNLTRNLPSVAEIDAVELYGHQPTGACHSTHQHDGGSDDVGRADCGRRWSTSREAADWHVYGVSITPVGVNFYLDGRLVATAAQVDGGDEPMFFLLDLALGGGWPVDLSRVSGRADLYVDYVRVYV